MKIIKPTVCSEFECQAYLYNALLNMGLDVKGEVVNKAEEKNKNGRKETSRFDLVVFNGENAVHVIEVKGDRRKDCSNWENTRQGVKYSKFGVKVSLVVGMDSCKEFIKNYKE